MGWPARLSFNQYTAGDRSFAELVRSAVAGGVTRLGLQRRPIEAFGFMRALEILQETDIVVTSYGSVGGWAGVYDHASADQHRADNLRYLDQAVQLGTSVVTVSSGGLAVGDRDIRAARTRVEAGLRELLPLVEERQLKLAIEPLHPIFVPDMSVLPTLRSGLELVERIDRPSVGLLVDTMHVWWDPELIPLLHRAADRVILVQINDWLPGAPHRLDRGLMGEGCIEFAPIITALDRFEGWYEVETLNDDLRRLDLGELLRQTASSFERTVEPHLTAPRLPRRRGS